MVVSIYAISIPRNIWSFREQPDAEPVRVRVPRGSKLLPVVGLGLDLYVPSEWDRLQLIRWSANQVMREAKGGRFKLVKTNGRERITS